MSESQDRWRRRFRQRIAASKRTAFGAVLPRQQSSHAAVRVQFYNGERFADSPAAGRLDIGPLLFTDAEIDALVAFLEET